MPRRMILGIALVISLLVGLGTPGTAGADRGPGANPPQNLPDYFVDETKLPFDALPGTSTTRQWGVLDGAGYLMEIPDDWNGELVMYAHGFAGYDAELTVAPPPLRAWLVANGFAWAASSYDRNGYVVEQGARDTRKLAKFFASRHGEPLRTYLVGVSMGGHITGYSIERYRGFYDAAMPVCGVLGDQELFDYFQSFHHVAQALTGVEAAYPAPPDYPLTTVPALVGALGGPRGTAYQQLAAVTEQLTGGSRVGFPIAYVSWFDFLMTLGAPPPGVAAFPADNRDTVYQLDGDPALNDAEEALNATVKREDRLAYPTPDGVWSAAPIKGRFRIPVLTMHTVGDLFVPFSMEQSYARKAAASGSQDWLVQRAIRDVGHCSFSEAEWTQGFADLVAWTRGGPRPAGDDVFSGLDAADYGCRFSANSGAFTGTPARPLFGDCPEG